MRALSVRSLTVSCDSYDHLGTDSGVPSPVDLMNCPENRRMSYPGRVPPAVHRRLDLKPARVVSGWPALFMEIRSWSAAAPVLILVLNLSLQRMVPHYTFQTCYIG
jgi:hypothetical protein